MQLLAKEPSLALENLSEDMAPVLDMRKLTEARVGVEEQQQEAIQAEPKRMALGNVLQLAESEAKGDPGSPQHPESGPRSEKENSVRLPSPRRTRRTRTFMAKSRSLPKWFSC
ncbi:unnamed protein product [Effrenium voratum]|nr:unnamed protein product [Effrenium voratum]